MYNYRLISKLEFTVKSKVFGERLRAQHFKSAGIEIADGPCIPIKVSGCEALISRVEKWK